MTLAILAFVAGLLTVLSPCILPVLPFVFARSDRSFAQGTLPLLAGLVASFALVASLGAVAGAWAVQLNLVGRWAALAALALFGASLLSPRLAAWWSAPLVRAGERLAATQDRGSWRGSALLGVATGLIWTPCAGPVLGVVLSTAALAGPGAHTSWLLVSYGAGAAVALGLALRVGSRPLAVLEARLLPGAAGRRVAGVAMLAAVAAVASGLDTAVLARITAPGAAGLEARLLQRVLPSAEAAEISAAPQPSRLPIESTRASLEGGTQWLNASPQSMPALRGKVVLVNFWTYSCVNCLRTLPYVKAWAQKYADRGLVVVGVHTPEFAFEKDRSHVERALRDLKIGYPVVQDNDYRIWRNFNNQYWPALYVVDAQGRVRHHQFGEGGYAASERVIEELLREAGGSTVDGALPAVLPDVVPDTQGPGLAADADTLRSPETYLGYEKGSAPRVAGRVDTDQPAHYQPVALQPNTWSLAGTWTLRPEFVEAAEAGGSVAVRFQARDANLVLGKGQGQGNSGPVRFRLTLDGQPPGAHHGTDVDAEGNGVVDATRLYQLVRQSGAVRGRTVEIRFLDPGARAYAFTFG